MGSLAMLVGSRERKMYGILFPRQQTWVRPFPNGCCTRRLYKHRNILKSQRNMKFHISQVRPASCSQLGLILPPAPLPLAFLLVLPSAALSGYHGLSIEIRSHLLIPWGLKPLPRVELHCISMSPTLLRHYFMAVWLLRC